MSNKIFGVERFYYLYERRPIIVSAYRKHDNVWYLPQLDIEEISDNLYTDAFNFYHSQLSKLRMPEAKPTKVSYLWIIDGKKSDE